MPPEPPAESPPLPTLLRLRPHRMVLPLGPSGRLLGLDPACAIAVDDLPPALAEMLDELAAPAEPPGLVARAVERGADGAAARALLHELVAAGALADAGGAERVARHRAGSAVVVVGRGPLAVGIVLGLHHGGVEAVHVETGGTVCAGDLGTGYQDADRGRDRLTATRAAVRRLIPAGRTEPPPQRLVPDLVVLADETPEPVRVSALLADGIAHLAARLRDGVGVVGPLVLPGRSACLGCLELNRAACDPGWPTVAAALVGRQGRADPACVAATAGLATAQALTALDGAGSAAGGAPPTLDATLELDVSAGTVVRRRWTASPECRCGAASTRRGADGGTRHGRETSAGRPDGDTIRR